MLHRTGLPAWRHTQGEKTLSRGGREIWKLTAQCVTPPQWPTQLLHHKMLWMDYAIQYSTVQCRPSPTSITPGQQELWIIQHHTVILITTLQVRCLALKSPAIKSSLLQKVSLCLSIQIHIKCNTGYNSNVQFQCHTIITNITGDSRASDGRLTVAYNKHCYRHDDIIHSLCRLLLINSSCSYVSYTACKTNH